ncbi:MAG: DUF1203 domain-containing protein [Hyphomonadaceae bacterium]|nr:DUF1203 domain-containing protein [Hyphomonadaceae bacterium]
MSYIVTGLSPEPFKPLFGKSDAELAALGVLRKTADSFPGYPCRISLEDASIGETVLLLNHASHAVETPYRSSYAIFVRENQAASARYVDELPPVFHGRPIALRFFDEDGMLQGASMERGGALEAEILSALARPDVAYIHAHNAIHGCFAAKIRRPD